MARSSRGRSSAAPRAPPAAPPPQTRSAHTAAAPVGNASAPAHHPPAPHAAAPPATAEPKQPGMLAQMAATAGSVAVGSTIGHGLSNMLFGSSHSAPAPAEQAPVQQQQMTPSCELQAKEFTKCLDKADLPSCTWYLEQLKACQAAAAPY